MPMTPTPTRKLKNVAIICFWMFCHKLNGSRLRFRAKQPICGRRLSKNQVCCNMTTYDGVFIGLVRSQVAGLPVGNRALAAEGIVGSGFPQGVEQR